MFKLNSKDYLLKNKVVIGIFLLSIIMGSFWGHRFFFGPMPNSNDQMIYSGLAINMLTKHEYTWGDGYETARPPGYPVFIAIIYAITNFNPVVVRFTQLFIFGIISVMVYFLGRRLFGEKVGIISGVFTACWWGIGNYANIMARETLIAFYSITLLWLLYLASEQLKIRYFVFIGLVLGVYTLTNPTPQYLILFLIVNFLFVLRKKMHWKKMIISLLLMVFSFSLVLTPWIIRNNKHYGGTGIAISPRAGDHLVQKMNYADVLYPDKYKYLFGYLFGFYFAEKLWPDLDIYAIKVPPENKLSNELEEQGYGLVEIDVIQTKNTVTRIINEPYKYFYKVVLDFLDLNGPLLPKRIFKGNDYAHFTFASGRFGDTSDYIKGGILIVFRISWYVFLFLVGYGFCKNIKNWDKVGWLFVVALYFNAVYSAVHAQPRFAVPIYPIYIILATVGFIILYNKYKIKYLS